MFLARADGVGTRPGVLRLQGHPRTELSRRTNVASASRTIRGGGGRVRRLRQLPAVPGEGGCERNAQAAAIATSAYVDATDVHLPGYRGRSAGGRGRPGKEQPTTVLLQTLRRTARSLVIRYAGDATGGGRLGPVRQLLPPWMFGERGAAKTSTVRGRGGGWGWRCWPRAVTRRARSSRASTRRPRVETVVTAVRGENAGLVEVEAEWWVLTSTAQPQPVLREGGLDREARGIPLVRAANHLYTKAFYVRVDLARGNRR